MLVKNTLQNFGSRESKTLNNLFNRFITKLVHSMSEEELSRTYTYDLIINEWDIEEKISYLEELKYRVTDGEDINQVLLDIIGNDELPTNIAKNQKSLLREYISQDKLKSFS